MRGLEMSERLQTCQCNKPTTDSLVSSQSKLLDKNRKPLVSRPPLIQTKLTINQPADEYEQEADRVAEQVMRMPDPLSVPQSPINSQPAGLSIQNITHYPEKDIQRKEDEDEEEGIVQMKQDSPSLVAGSQKGVPPSVHEVLSSPGLSLDQATRAFMEPRFGHDFSRVRVHFGPAAEQSAREVNSNAYTVGHNIVFGADRFEPGTNEGRRLIAHELVHVIQQNQRSQQVQRWANCKPPRLSLEDCPPRQPGEVQRAKNGSMVFLSLEPLAYSRSILSLSLKIPETKGQGVLIANFDINSAAIKPNLYETILWKQFLREISGKRSQWKLLSFTDCHGAESLNKKLREDRAVAVFKILPPEVKAQVVSYNGAPNHECIAENNDSADRALNRSVAIILETPSYDIEPTVITGCIPPAEQKSSGKRCKFYIYDSTEPTGLAWKWKTAALALAAFRPGAYVIPSGDNIEEALEGILDTYASKDCGCTEEVQFWSHGSPANAMSISKTNDELTTNDFNIPDLDKFGYGPTSMPGYREWHSKLSARQRRLVLLRRTLCDPDAEVYYRSCEAFQGKKGQEFAKASTEFWRSTVVGHTKIIGLTQPGKKVLKPCQEPYWSELEGVGGTAPKKRDISADVKPRKD
jgi:outer membrane protein OmpA-like peptidoglycan-associated protein